MAAGLTGNHVQCHCSAYQKGQEGISLAREDQDSNSKYGVFFKKINYKFNSVF
jgi:hypothetical protein